MKKYLPLNQVKSHLHLDDWYDDEDEYLTGLIYVAQKAIENHIGYDLKSLTDENGELEAPLCHAMLLLVGHLYANRESTSELSIKEVPHAYDYLLQPYKNYLYD